MQLTDKQLNHLLEANVWDVVKETCGGGGAPPHPELRNMGLMCAQKEVIFGTESITWKLTELGEETLWESVVRALMLLPASSFVADWVCHLIKPLSAEELPELLTHPNRTIREFARMRLKELGGG